MADTEITELAYFAGFFDGEGSVGSYERRHVVSLTNADPRPLKRAMELWGGRINQQDKSSRPAAVRDIWRWQIYGQHSRCFLEAIRPYLQLKSEQVDIYLAILDVLPKARGERRKIGASQIIADGSAQLRLLKRGGA